MDIYEVYLSRDYEGSRTIGVFASKQLADSVAQVLDKIREAEGTTYARYGVSRSSVVTSVAQAREIAKDEADTFYDKPITPEMLNMIGGPAQAVQASVARALDRIANDLESKGLLAEAEQVDIVANTIDAGETKPMLKASDPRRKRVNSILSQVSKEYRPQIPLDEIFKALEDNGLVAIAEDGTKWEGFLTGREGRAIMDVASLGEVPRDGMRTPIENAKLVVSWFKMPSGKYETNSYLG